jgi:uncharacterized protein YprB with RNaseH-like and TPR domain
MGRLKSKLERRKREAEPSSDLIRKLKNKMKKIEDQRRPTHRCGDEKKKPSGKRYDLAGEEVHTEKGTVLLCTKRYPTSYRHGRYTAADFLGAGPGLAVLAKDTRFKDMDLTRALFLDTETTGLSGGTGTLSFLVGVGWLEDTGVFKVEQYFCREPGEEGAQLSLLATRLKWASCLVTFNGRSFDIPLLNTRFILQKMKNPGYGLPHLDLLHVARRVFKKRLDSCRLGNLEGAVLGFERIGDIPGSEIPGVYAAFLRGGPVGPIEAVLEHNALDLVGLAALGAVIEEMYGNPGQVEHAADSLGLARAALVAGDHKTADSHLSHASRSGPKMESAEALFIAAREASRNCDFARAKTLLLRALAKNPNSAPIHLALAKLFEHRDKIFDRALEHALFTADAEGQGKSLHRIARLKRRMGLLSE